MLIQPNNRFSYEPISERPDFKWPDDKRLAVYVAIGVEHFSYGTGMGIPYSDGMDHPNSYNYGWREYGNRVGAWRLIELFEEFDRPLSVVLNTACYEHCPSLVQAFSKRGDEIIAHGYTNSIHPNHMSEDEERQMIESVTKTIEDREGKPPAGWMSPGANPSARTEDVVASCGYRYTLDWPIDDQPVWMTTDEGPILSIPYPQEVNDLPMMVLHDGTAEDFANLAIDNLDEMLLQSRRQSLVYGITIHSFIVGRPFRIRQFRRVLEQLNKRSSDVWFTTPGQIAGHFARLFPPGE